MNDMSSEILYVLDPAQSVCMLEGNISRHIAGIRHKALAATQARRVDTSSAGAVRPRSAINKIKRPGGSTHHWGL